MRILVTLLLCLAFLTVAATAEEAAKPFDQMTLEELQAVDSKALPRDAKKLFKKALKSAKKAEKQRIRAEKKAEKARIRAEKKRLRAEEKRLKAERKRKKAEARRMKEAKEVAARRLAFIKSTYDETAVFEAGYGRLSIQGQQASHYDSFMLTALGTNSARVHYQMQISTDTDFNTLNPQLHISVSRGIPVEREEFERVGPMKYAKRHGVWRRYRQASTRTGARRALHPTDRYVEGNCYSLCYFLEEVAIDLSIEDIMSAIQNGQGMSIRLHSHRAPTLFVDIAYDYLVGLMARVADESGGKITLHRRAGAHINGLSAQANAEVPAY